MKAVANLMAASDKHILAAMEGLDPSAESSSVPSKPRDEPVAYFFVLFGLVFEVLSTSSADSTASPATLEVVNTALKALTSLVKPEYAGKAILEPSTFDEVSNLAYRLALTAAPTVQIYLVGAIASLANGQKDRLLALAAQAG